MLGRSSVALVASSLIFVGAAGAQTPSTDTGTPSPPPAAVPGTTVPSTPDSAASGPQISTSPTLTAPSMNNPISGGANFPCLPGQGRQTGTLCAPLPPGAPGSGAPPPTRRR